MKQRMKPLKHFTPSLVLLVLAILATLFAHPHIIVPVVLITGAVVMAWQNYRALKVRARTQEQEQ